MALKINNLNIKLIHKVLCVVLGMVFVLSSAAVTTLTWSDNNQHKTNVADGNSPLQSMVILSKLEKDPQGNKTETKIEGAQFLLYKENSSGDDTQIGDVYTTNAAGQITVKELLPGNYYFVETEPSYGYIYDKDENNRDIKKYPFTIKGDEEEQTVLVTAYNRKVNSGLVISKTVKNGDGTALTAEQLEMEFEFTVTFSDNGSYKYTIGNAEYSLNSGDKLYLKHNQTAVFENLPLGVLYTVSETPVEDYFITSSGHRGNITEGISKAQFTNTYGKPEEKTGSLEITKEVAGNAGDQNKGFQFTVTFSDKGTYKYKIGMNEYELTSGGKLTLKHGETAVFEDLPLGITYKVTEDDYSADGYTATIQEAQGTVIQQGSKVTFINYKEDKPEENFGNLEISKEVTGADGDKTKDFQFTITFSDNGTYKYTVNNGAEQELASGGTLTLKHGQTAKFTNIPAGVTYTVTEADYTADGYLPSIKTATGAIPANWTAKVHFVNWKEDEPQDDKGSLKISKTVSGKDADQNKEFLFTVTFSDDGTYKYKIGADEFELTSGGKLSLKHGQTAVFENLPVGITYQVTEDDYSADGYTALIDGASGTIIKQGSKVDFVNHKDDEPEEDTGSLQISKEVTGTGADKTKDFAFTVMFSDGGTYKYTINGGEEKELLSGGVINLKHGQTAIFTDIPKGVTYTVMEADYTKDDYLPSIKLASGTIAGGATAKIHFVNSKTDKPDEKETTLIVKKVVKGEVPEKDKNKEFHFIIVINGEETKFTLKDGEEKHFTLPYGALYEVYEDNYIDDYYAQSIVNGFGTASGGTVEVIQTNTFIGVITIQIKGEKTWNMAGAGDGKKPESITIYLKNGDTVVETATVTPDDNGKWTYTFNAPKYDGNGKEIAYTIVEKPIENFVSENDGYNIKNTYVPPITQTMPTVKKVITGDKPLTDVQFDFILKAQKGAPMPEGVTTNTKIITISGEGEKAFGEITYTKPGVYVYTITEVEGSFNSYTYDTSVYTLTVTVTMKDNKLTATQVLVKNEKEMEKAVFENTYTTDDPTPNKEKITIEGYKKWVHGNNDPDNYPESIIIYVKSDNKVVVSKEISKDNYWRWAFVLDKHDENGNEIVYTIDEAPVDGYTKTVEGYNITNTHKTVNPPDDSEKVTVSGTKHWYHGSNSSNPPYSVTVYVKNGNVKVASQTITAKDGWKYSFELPKHDSEGNEITYTVDEEAVENYGKYIKGYDLYNSYGRTNGYDPTTPGGSSQTGDTSPLWLWITLMAVSAVTFTALIIYGKKRKIYRPTRYR